MTDAQPQRLAALRYRDFRLIWFGEMVSTTGSKMQQFAINWHVFALLRGQIVTLAGVELSAEALGLGLVGLVRILPIVFFALLGGMLADTRDRRKVMLWTRATATVFALMLAAFLAADAGETGKCRRHLRADGGHGGGFRFRQPRPPIARPASRPPRASGQRGQSQHPHLAGRQHHRPGADRRAHRPAGGRNDRHRAHRHHLRHQRPDVPGGHRRAAGPALPGWRGGPWDRH